MVWGGRGLAERLGKTLPSEPAALVGGEGGTFPWLVKYLDACDWPSMQVHPDERAVARLLPGEGSKTEAWFVLAARPGCRVYAGLLYENVPPRRGLTSSPAPGWPFSARAAASSGGRARP